MRNLLCRVPKSAQPFVATMVRTVFAQPSAQEVAAQLARVVEQLQERFPQVAAMLVDAAPDVTAFAAFPTEHWRQILVEQPAGAPQPRDPPAHGRRRHLPPPGCGHQADRHGARRATR
jgi:Transposase, Mutator family